MSTVVAPANGKSTAIAAPKQEATITYVPLGETAEITLTLSRTKQFLCAPTRLGKMPSDEQVVKYMMLCKAQGLNPWLNDAYLTGYDTKDGPSFSLITAIQAFYKRAEASPQYDGIESGVIVQVDEAVTERQGDLVLKGEQLIGGWAKVYRKDRKFPSYDALNLATYDKNQSRWNTDKPGMIVKCAEASALRKAFPSTLAAMYCKEEMDRERERDHTPTVEAKPKADRLADRLLQATVVPTKIAEPASEAPVAEAQPVANQVTSADLDERFAKAIEAATTMEQLDALETEINHAWNKGDCEGPDLLHILGQRRTELER